MRLVDRRQCGVVLSSREFDGEIRATGASGGPLTSRQIMPMRIFFDWPFDLSAIFNDPFYDKFSFANQKRNMSPRRNATKLA